MPNLGSPKSNLGVAPGMGGSQRLTRAIKVQKHGNVSDPNDECRGSGAVESNRTCRATSGPTTDALKTAATIAKMPDGGIAEEMVNSAFEMTLDQGLIVERRIFQILRHQRTKQRVWQHLSKSVLANGRDDNMKIAFIGLGNMGSGMAANLVKAGHDVNFDLSRGTNTAKNAGCKTFNSASEACVEADAVVSMLLNGVIVKEVYTTDVIGNADCY